MVKKTTRLVAAGRAPEKHGGMVNTPIYQSSTVLFPTLDAYHQAEKGKEYYEEMAGGSTLDFSYGIGGTPTIFALQQALAELEKGDACVLTSSGLSAITATLLSVLKAGDHVLMVDSVYGPTRRFCNKNLSALNIETTYYDSTIGQEIASLIQDNTRVIFMESPGSLTFEMQDVAAISAIARKKNIVTMFDNSWASPLYFNPLDHGVDISIQAVTKYISGHSDILLGAVITKGEEITRTILQGWRHLGMSASPNECYLALRGLRTMEVRMKQHKESTLLVAEYLKNRPEVQKLLCPMVPGCDGHDMWKRDFAGGGASLISVVLDKRYDAAALSSMVDNLTLFGIGASWGGFESLVLDFNPSTIRTVSPWPYGDATCLRFYVGLEDPDDLIADLEAGFNRLCA